MGAGMVSIDNKTLSDMEAKIERLEGRIAKAIEMLERQDYDYSWYYRAPLIISVLQGEVR